MTLYKIKTGAHSVVYQDDKNPNIIIKEPRNEPDKYLQSQKYGFDAIARLKQSGNDYGVGLPELVEIINTPEQKQIIEKKINGVIFDHNVYNSLDEQTKETLAIQMANFLNAMHQQQKPESPKESIKENYNDNKYSINSARDILRIFENQIPQHIAQLLIDAEKYLNTSNIADEVYVNTHSDVHTYNIIYNPDNKQLTVIDFELSGLNNIYRDFVPHAAGLSLNWDFLQRVIKYYNDIPNKKYQITINPEKVKNIIIYGVFAERARVLYNDRINNTPVDTQDRVNLLIHRLLELNIIKKSDIFKNATKQLLGQGAASLVYTTKNDKNVVTKQATNIDKNANGQWISRQQTGHNIIDKIRESGKNYGVNLPEFVSSVKTIDTNTGATPYQEFKETLVPGENITDRIYSTIDNKTKNELALQLAKFLYVMHNLSVPRPATPEERQKDVSVNIRQFSTDNLINIIHHFKNESLKQTLINAINAQNQPIGPDEVIVNTHGDLRWPNIMYDKKHKKLGVIDFENARFGHIYRDFISYPTSFDWDFIERIIQHYNKIKYENNDKNYLNANKIKQILICDITKQAVKDIIETEINQATPENIKIDSATYKQRLFARIEQYLKDALTEYNLIGNNKNTQIIYNNTKGRI